MGTKMKGAVVKAGHILKKLIKSPCFWLITLLLFGLLLRLLARSLSGFADVYCNTVYRFFSILWNNISGIVPFSLAEILLFLIPLSLIVYLIYIIVMSIKLRRKKSRIAEKGFLRILAFACAMYFLYVTNCGINYYCSGFAVQSGLETKPVSSEELYEVCIYLASKASDCRTETDEDESGVMKIDKSSALHASAIAVNRLHEKYSFFPEGYSAPKPVILSKGMSYFNITGVFFPYTFEANVNMDAPDCSIPFTMCHELAHVRGYMQEQEANFIAFLACINSDNNDFRYSGYLSAMMYAGNSLYSADKELYKKYASHVSDKVWRDFGAYYEYWEQFETPAAEAASSINDSYLKSNSQSSGIKSYGMITDLIIAYYYSDKEDK